MAARYIVIESKRLEIPQFSMFPQIKVPLSDVDLPKRQQRDRKEKELHALRTLPPIADSASDSDRSSSEILVA